MDFIVSSILGGILYDLVKEGAKKLTVGQINERMNYIYFTEAQTNSLLDDINKIENLSEKIWFIEQTLSVENNYTYMFETEVYKTNFAKRLDYTLMLINKTDYFAKKYNVENLAEDLGFESANDLKKFYITSEEPSFRFIDEVAYKIGVNKDWLKAGDLNTNVFTSHLPRIHSGRNVYQTRLEDGTNAHVYLLDQAMKMDKIGMISTNLAEKIAMTVTESPYRVSADIISSTCGQTISHGGVWNLIQQLGDRISKEESVTVMEMEADQSKGKEVIPVLFEEMVGVWLRMQGKDHKRMKKQEMKVSVMYEGWKKDGKNNNRLVNKTVLAGMEKSEEFHKKREAQIRKIYDADEIKQRILNGDGGSWIKDPYDPDTIFQLDRFHIYQEIKRKIKDKEAEKTVTELFDQEKMDEMLEYIKIYADSVASNEETDKRSSNALKLYEYLNNNKEGLVPYQKRGIEIPAPKEGIVYKNMGVQENQNCTTITMRMKHRRMRWSPSGANSMAKVLYTKENKKLIETIDRYTDGLIFNIQMQEIITILSAAKAPKKDGKGNEYIDLVNHHIPLFEGMQTVSRKAFKRAFGY